MDEFIGGMIRGMAARAAGADRSMVFDWAKAEEILASRGWPDAEAGLAGDWGSTSGEIVRDGAPCWDSYTYLASIWAIPSLLIDGEEIACWRWQEEVPDWDCKTKWPGKVPPTNEVTK